MAIRFLKYKLILPRNRYYKDFLISGNSIKIIL